MHRAVGLLGLALAVLTGCGSPPHAADDVRTAMAAYQAQPDDATAAEVEARFARLDAEIAERRAEAARADAEDRPAAEAEVETLERSRAELRREYVSIRMRAVGNAAGDALKEMGRSIGEGLEEAGRKLREAAGGNASAPEE